MVVDIEANLPHTVSEIICVKCHHRYICARPTSCTLNKLECAGCEEIGYMIETGEIMEED